MLVLDDTNLLCDNCKAVLAQAREAMEAVRKLQEMRGQAAKPSAPEPWEGRPGRTLSREERLQKARALLPASAPPPKPEKPVHQTLNGTVVTAPHLLLPRKKITKAAEKDIERVLKGTMTQVDWSKKHGYSVPLLRKRLEIRGALDPHTRTRDGYNLVPGYVPPSQKLSDDEIKRALSGELSVAKLAKRHDIPVGTVYRLIAEYNKRRGTEAAPAAIKRGRPLKGGEPDIDEGDLKNAVAGRLSVNGLANKYGITWNTAQLHVKKYKERFGISDDDEGEGDDNEEQSKKNNNEELSLFDREQTESEHREPPPILDELKNLANGEG